MRGQNWTRIGSVRNFKYKTGDVLSLFAWVAPYQPRWNGDVVRGAVEFSENIPWVEKSWLRLLEGRREDK